MSLFTGDELRFLSRYNFSEDEVHDGRSQTKIGREMAAKAAGKILVLTNTRCRAMGHRLRTRAGHCPMQPDEHSLHCQRKFAGERIYRRLSFGPRNQDRSCRRHFATRTPTASGAVRRLRRLVGAAPR